ncbi:MAG: ribbon-helix-helix domain-containing protein [Blastocatellia bacterium]
MSMTITLKPETERLVQQELDSGHFHNVDEIIVEGVQARLATLREKKQSRREAVRRVREFRDKHRLSLGDIRIKDLIHEGHRL